MRPGPRLRVSVASFLMLALVWPAAWLLLLVIIPVDGWFARRMLALQWSRALSVSALANVASTRW